MKRDLSSIKEMPGGWRNFEYLDPKVEKFTELLDKYKLQVEHGDAQVWVATLMPYSFDKSIVPEVKAPGKFTSLLLKNITRKNEDKSVDKIHC